MNDIWKNALVSLDTYRQLVGQEIGVSSWHLIDQKRIDALALLEAVRDRDDQRVSTNRNWEFRRTTLWSEQLTRLNARTPLHL